MTGKDIKIRAGEADMADTRAQLRQVPSWNGRAATMGFCYGGPFAVLGPARLGYDAGIGCHSTQMKDYLGEFDNVAKPVCLLWGDQDNMAPPEVLDAYRALAVRRGAIEQRRVLGAKALGVAEGRACAAGIQALFQGENILGIARGNTQSRDIDQQVLAPLFCRIGDIPDRQRANPLGQRFRHRR